MTLSSTLRLTVELPASKSISARALVIKALAESSCELRNLSDCDDTKAVIRAFTPDEAQPSTSEPRLVDIGAAGTAMRFLTAFYATREGKETILTGTERMQHRPIRLLVEALRTLGADIAYEGEEGYPPLRIRGRKLKGGEVRIPADVSSQYISALLMVGPTLTNGLVLHLEGEIASRPYILMTLKLMEQFGAKATFEDHTITILPQPYKRTEPYLVEPDWSAASYWYELVALAPDAGARVVLPHLAQDSVQGDSVCAKLFTAFGVQTQFTSEGAVLTKGSLLAASSETVLIDFADCPDLAQTFVVTAALLDVPFTFSGLKSLKIKETDRVAALIAELTKLGYIVEDAGDGVMTYRRERCTAEAVPSIKTYEDHRMAMAFAPASYRFPALEILNPEVVSKSYPSFWKDIDQLKTK